MNLDHSGVGELVLNDGTRLAKLWLVIAPNGWVHVHADRNSDSAVTLSFPPHIIGTIEWHQQTDD